MNKYDFEEKDDISSYLIRERNKEDAIIWFKYLGIGFFICILMLITYLLSLNGYLPKMKIIDILGETCFIPLFISVILAFSHRSLSAIRRLKGRAKGRIVNYKVIDAHYSHVKRYYVVPIIEYELNGISYVYLSDQRGLVANPKNVDVIKNKEVTVRYNLSAPGDARIKYNFKQLMELNGYVLTRLIIITTVYLIFRMYLDIFL